MRRGDIWWADLGEPDGIRPVLLLSRDRAYTTRQLITVATLTTHDRNIPSQVSLTTRDGVARACVANLDDIHTIDKDSCTELLTHLNTARLRDVDEAIHFALGLAF